MLDVLQNFLTACFFVVGCIFCITWLLKHASQQLRETLDSARRTLTPKAVVPKNKEKKKKKEEGEGENENEEVGEGEEENTDDNQQNQESPLVSFGPRLDQIVPLVCRTRVVINDIIIPWFTVAFVLGFAVSIGLYLLYADSDPSDGNEHEDPGFVLHANDPVTNNVPYYTAANYVNQKKKQRVPILGCTHYHLIDPVHNAVLKSVRLVPNGLVPVSSENGQGGKSLSRPVATPYAIDDIREEARTLCMIGKDDMLYVNMGEEGDPIAYEKYLNKPVLWQLKRNGNDQVNSNGESWLRNALSSAVFVDNNQSRFYRVAVVHQKHGDVRYRLHPMIVSEQNLLDAIEQWYHDMLVTAEQTRLLQDPACLCPEHFGIVGSGLYFRYYPSQQKWRILLHPKISRDLTQPNHVSHVRYSPNIAFPYKVDIMYNPGKLTHYNHAEVQYLDPTVIPAVTFPKHLEEEPLVHMLIRLTDPSQQQLLQKLQIMENWIGDDLACFHHCAAMDDKIAEHAPEDLKMYKFW